MRNYNFVGMPYYKDDIASKLHDIYPQTSISKFMLKSIRQLRQIYGETIRRKIHKE